MKKRVFFIAIIFSFISAVLYAEDSDYKLSFEPFVECVSGNIGEYVYTNNTNGDDVLYSYLDWELKPVWIYGLNAEAIVHNLGISIRLASAMPTRCGNMYDSDWLNKDNMKTTYSISENSLESYLDIALKVFYEFDVSDFFSAGPTMEIGTRSIKFSAENGYGWYGQPGPGGYIYPYNSGEPYASEKHKGDLCGIDYQKDSVYTFLGARIKINAGNRFHFIAEGALSPYTRMEAYDTHWRDMRKTSSNDYKDKVSSYFKTFKGDLSAYFDLNDAISFKCNFGGSYSMKEKGTTYQKVGVNRSYVQSQGHSGMSESSIHFGAGIKINIF